MMQAQTVSYKHMRTIQQNLLRLQITSNILNFKLFTSNAPSSCYSASLSYEKLLPPFSSIFNNLQELYKQFKEISQSHLSFDSQKCELKYLIQTSTKICQLRICMQKMPLDRIYELQIQNFKLIKRQEQMCQIIEAKMRQIQQYKLKDKKKQKLKEKTQSIITISQQHDKSGQQIVKQEELDEEEEEECSEGPQKVQSKSDIQSSLSSIKEQYPSSKVSRNIPKTQQIVNSSLSLKSEYYEESVSNTSKTQEIHQFSQDNCPIPITRISIDQKNVAKVLIKYGFGFKTFKETINASQVTPSKYTTLITTIMRNTFKTIQSAARMVNDPIIQVGAHQLTLIRTPLANSRTWLPQKELQTFHNFIRIIYGIGDVRISASSARKLYKQIIKHLERRKSFDQFYRSEKTEDKQTSEKSQRPSIKRRVYFQR